jgi:ribosomal-protein-alanine N-acetyltransferase
MTPRAITIRLAEPRDAQAIAQMSRDFIESGLGWKYDAARVLRAMRDRETLAVVACEGGKTGASANGARAAVAGFAIMEFGDERAHLVLLAVRPSHRRLGIGQRMLDWMLESARVAGMASIHLELRAGNDAARRFYRAMGFYETVLVPGYYRSGEGRKEGALRMLRVLRTPGPVPYTWRPPKTEDT